MAEPAKLEAAPGKDFVPLLRIASGGMATVFLGVSRAEPHAGWVAIKRPHEHLLQDKKFVHSLSVEADVARRLHHPNVVTVRATDQVEGIFHLVMDYVDGTSLFQLLVSWADGGEEVPEDVAVRMVLDACEGVQALHELAGSDGLPAGFIHRDVSPQNVLVGVDGIARITDFGLAKCVWATDQQTTEGTLKGKLGYMAPEYVRGERIDHRVDVFALGVVLWEALTGSRLFRGENEADALERVLRAEVPTVASARAGRSEIWQPVLDRALQRDRGARYPSARAMADHLREIGEAAGCLASQEAVAALVARVAGGELQERRTQADDKLAAWERARSRARYAGLRWAAWGLGGLALVSIAGLAVASAARRASPVLELGASSVATQSASDAGSGSERVDDAASSTAASSASAQPASATATAPSAAPPRTSKQKTASPPAPPPPNPYR